MMGVLPGCFKLEMSEPDFDGKRDYIIEPSQIHHTQTGARLNLGASESINPKIRARQLAFLDVLKRASEQNYKDDDISDLLCLESDTASAVKKFDTKKLPREYIPCIKELQKSTFSKRVRYS